MLEADVDVLALRDAPLPRLVEVVDRLVADGADGGVLTALVDLAIDEAVRLVRRGSRSDLLTSASALARFLAGPGGRKAQARTPGAHDTLCGLLPVLTAASSPASGDGDSLVLRSWSGKAQAALEQIAAAGGVLPRIDLRRQLGISESHLSHLLSDLEDASLVERVGAPGRRSVEVHLAPKGRELASARPSRPTPVQRLRTVCPVASGDLRSRLEASTLAGGPSERLRPLAPA
jgi:DNA-binding MarR family transcriptional regulator